MALDIAVPKSGCGDMLENFNLLSPIPSHESESRNSLKILCSPFGSESSGVSSLDSEEIKKSSTSSSPIEERGSSVSSSVSSNNIGEDILTQSEDEARDINQQNEKSHLSPKPKISDTDLASPKPKHPNNNDEVLVHDVDAGNAAPECNETKSDKDDNNEINGRIEKQKVKEYTRPKWVQIMLNERNILALGANINNSEPFLQYAFLPNSDLKMYLENRSQYHRLSASGNLHEYDLAKCVCCDFVFPVSYPVSGYDNVNTCNVNDKLDNNGNAKNRKGGGLAAALLTGMAALDESLAMISPAIEHQHVQQQQPETIAYPPINLNDLMVNNYQNPNMNTLTAMLNGGNKEITLNSLYANGNTNNNQMNRIFGNNTNSNINNNANWDNMNAILNNHNNNNNNNNAQYGQNNIAVQAKNYHHYLNQVVPPSPNNYGYYKQF